MRWGIGADPEWCMSTWCDEQTGLPHMSQAATERFLLPSDAHR